jgi:putative ABC transport system permease protein
VKQYKTIPPALAQRLLTTFLRDELVEEVSGDLDEKFYIALKTKSRFRANLNYWYQVIHYLRPFAIKKRSSTSSNNLIMFQHYSKIAWRNMLRDKAHFLINASGLALSMFCAMLVILWIMDELSYEKFYPQSEQIYRLVQDQHYDNGDMLKVAANPGILPIYLKENFSGIKQFTRFRPLPNKVLVQNN